MDEVRFTVPGLAHPGRHAEYRTIVRREAARAFGTRRFWNEVFGQIELHFQALVKRNVKGDMDNYAKNILDGMNSIAYNDDSQVSAVHVFWIDHVQEEALIQVSGQDLIDMGGLDEIEYMVRGRPFVCLVESAIPNETRELLILAHHKLVDSYFEAIDHGLSEAEARYLLPIICEKYPRKGGFAR